MEENSGKVQNSLKDWIVPLGVILSFFLTLVSLLVGLQDLAQDPQRLRVVSISFFIVYLLVSLWFAFKARNVSRNWKLASLGLLYLFSCLYFVWVGTWIVPAPEPVIIDKMDDISLWSTYKDEKGADPIIKLVPGRTTSAMELSYTVDKDGWVGVAREISSQLLTNTKGIRFYYKGNGAPNTIELKLITKPDEDGKSAIYSVLWNHATDVRDWTSLEAPYVSFVCWTDTGCKAGEAPNPKDLWKIDIAISSKSVDTPGSGVVIFDDIQGVR